LDGHLRLFAGRKRGKTALAITPVRREAISQANFVGRGFSRDVRELEKQGL
jgi:hypothetical protein